MADRGELTLLLKAAHEGDASAFDRLMAAVYEELHRIARRELRRRPGSLDSQGLVHEAYMKLVGHAQTDWNDRHHFFAVAAVAMRNLLVDQARRQLAEKRGGDRQRVTLDLEHPDGSERTVDILALDRALDELGARSERLRQLVELRFFAGLSVAETASALATSERTVKRDWVKARAFLYRMLGDGAPPR